MRSSVLSVSFAAPAAGACMLLALLWWATPPPAPAFRACPFYWLTGMPCPLCGLTRGLCELAKGHCLQAIRFNALSPLALMLLFSLFSNPPWKKALWSFGIAAFAIYGVCRIALA